MALINQPQIATNGAQNGITPGAVTGQAPIAVNQAQRFGVDTSNPSAAQDPGSNFSIGSLISSLGQLGSTAIGSTAGTQAAQNFQAQGNNAINAQNQYLKNANAAAQQGAISTGGNLSNSQQYTQNAVNSQGQYSNLAQGLGQTSIGNQNNLLAQANQYNQAGISEGQNASSGLNKIFNNTSGTPDYSGFNNNPGYQFAVQQGNAAINRQAAAAGGLYSTNTLANLSQYNTGMASQNYNNYVSQLMQMAGIGNSASQNAAGNTIATGQSQAGTYQAGMSNALGIAGNVNSAYNQGSINPLTAAGIQNQDYLKQADQQFGTGQSVGDIYQNIGQYNASGTTANLGALNSGVQSATGTAGALSNLLKQGQNLYNNYKGSSGYTSTGAGDYLTGTNPDLSASGPDLNSLNGTFPSVNYGDYNPQGDVSIDLASNSDGSYDLPNIDDGSFSSAGGEAAQSQGPDLSANGPDLNSLNGTLGSISGSSPTGQSLGSPVSAGFSTLGGLNSAYNAINNPTPGNVLSAASGANSAVNSISKATGNGSLTSPLIGEGLSLAGQGLSIYNAIQHPSAASIGSGAVNAAALGSEASQALGGVGLGVSAGVLGGIAGGAAIIGGGIDQVVQESQRGGPLTFQGQGVSQDPYGKLPSGNSIATVGGNIGIGEGNNEAKGSGQLYFINPNGSTANNTKYQWLGQAQTNAALKGFQDYQEAGGDSFGTTAQTAQGAAQANNIYGTSLYGLDIPQMSISNPGTLMTPSEKALLSQYANKAPSTNPGLSELQALYQSTGGKDKWGESQDDWTGYIIKLFKDAQENGGMGLDVGKG